MPRKSRGDENRKRERVVDIEGRDSVLSGGTMRALLKVIYEALCIFMAL